MFYSLSLQVSDLVQWFSFLQPNTSFLCKDSRSGYGHSKQQVIKQVYNTYIMQRWYLAFQLFDFICTQLLTVLFLPPCNIKHTAILAQILQQFRRRQKSFQLKCLTAQLLKVVISSPYNENTLILLAQTLIVQKKKIIQKILVTSTGGSIR